MHVRRETSTERECVGAGLFLRDTPLLCAIPLSIQVSANQFRPLDARFRFDQTMLLIERNYPIERTRIDTNAASGKLLASHRMPAARNRDRQTFLRRRTHNLRTFVSTTSQSKFADARAIKRRVDVVNPMLSLRLC